MQSARTSWQAWLKNTPPDPEGHQISTLIPQGCASQQALRLQVRGEQPAQAVTQSLRTAQGRQCRRGESLGAIAGLDDITGQPLAGRRVVDLQGNLEIQPQTARIEI